MAQYEHTQKKTKQNKQMPKRFDCVRFSQYETHSN